MIVKVSDISDAVREKLDNFFPGRNNYVNITPGGVLLPQKYKDLAESIDNFAVSKDDVWVISYPRTGSTWAQEMVWLLGHNLDFETAKNQILAVRAPILELSVLFSEDHHEWVKSTMGNSVKCLQHVPSPRFARSHLSWELLPKQIHEVKPKVIYTARNPKDLCVSYYHYFRLLHDLSGTLDEFCEMFMTGKIPLGSYWNHVLKFWEHRDDDNILFLKYETMKRDLPAVIKTCAAFLEVDLDLSSESLDKICDHLKFDKMQLNPSVNLQLMVKQDNDPKSNAKFIRKGQIGDWKNYLSDDLSRKFDEWIEENTRDTGLSFEYE